MKNIHQTFTSPVTRILVYLSIFIVGAALHELLVWLLKPTIWSHGSIALTLATLVAFTLVGGLFVCERHLLSRVTSAATMFVLGLIALRIGHSVVPDPYLLVVALFVAMIGARPVLHRKAASVKRAVLSSLLVVFISIIVALTFAYGMTVLDRAVIQRQYDLYN